MPQCNNVNGDWVFLVLVDNSDLEESALNEYLKKIEHFKEKEQVLFDWTCFRQQREQQQKKYQNQKVKKWIVISFKSSALKYNVMHLWKDLWIGFQTSQGWQKSNKQLLRYCPPKIQWWSLEGCCCCWRIYEYYSISTMACRLPMKLGELLK